MESGAKGTRPLLLVVNPKAGRGEVKGKLCGIVSILTSKGFAVTVYPTRRSGTAEYVRDNIAGYERVVCCGGDGTMSEVLSGAAVSGLKTPVGHIPLGTTNDFAASLGLPKKARQAAERAAGDDFMYFDMASLNGRPFSYIAAAGAFTKASYQAPQYLKTALGRFAYILEGARSLFDIKPFGLELAFDGRRVKGDFIYASLSNTLSVGGVVKYRKEAVDFADGAFELLLVRRPETVAEAASIVADILAGRSGNRNILFFHVKGAKFTFDRPTVFTLDGEKGEALTEGTARVYKNKVVLIV